MQLQIVYTYVVLDNVQDVIHHGKRTIYTAGRPPWYDVKGELKEAFVIGNLHPSHLLIYILFGG